MSKNCAICGGKITYLNENSLSKDYPKVKICFTCYEYVATGIRGNNKAVTILKSRYRDDITPEVKGYVDALDVDIMPKSQNDTKDEFMDLMDNDLTKMQRQKKSDDKKTKKSNVIRLEKLTAIKRDRLKRIQIGSTILTFAFALLGPLFAFYILTQGHGVMLSVVMFIAGLGFAILFGFIKNILTVLLDS